ncbi:aminotransferase class I/II-fold pyridoxal phosphate-dependent enzyme [Streptosporangiaceae bacterium NEAU-GS5]|nr:aminotransferase class I/II-fold pyridoxal phosphate-dependent enzyme [Streptosporangiaceae bacterium NEAU-GS5]
MTKSFGSDNHAGVHPAVLDAIVAANAGDAMPYGADPWTSAMEDAFRHAFGPSAHAYAMFNGTGANVVGLGLLLARPYEAVLCPAPAHIYTHEAGASERVLGVRLVPVPTDDGKITPESLAGQLHGLGDEHEVQPKVVSISQVTECGTVYTPGEIGALADFAHGHGMYLHMDGARLANAAAYLGCSLRETTADVGVDVLSFGGTKNGALGAEALVVFSPELAGATRFLRKQGMQLSSKMRFVSVQLTALLTDDLWRTAAAHANAMAFRLADGIRDLVTFRYAVQSNAIFPVLPREVIESLQQRFTFHTWSETESVVRLMTAFDTTSEDVDHFATAIRTTLKP